MPRVLIAAVAALIVAWALVAETTSASAAAGRQKCVRIIHHASGDMVENSCGGCRLVSVQRARPGAGKPTSQTVTVPKQSRQPLAFLGPGHTRITAHRPCPGAAPESPRSDAASNAAPGGKCVRFLRTRTGGAALVNPCQVCRTVKVEFVDTAGNRTRRAFAIAPNAPLSVPAAGMAKARILMDTPCG